MLTLPHDILEKILYALSPWTARRHLFHASIFARTCRPLQQLLCQSFFFWEKLFRRSYVITRSNPFSLQKHAVCVATLTNFRYCQSVRQSQKALLDRYCAWVSEPVLPLDRGCFVKLVRQIFYMEKSCSCRLCGARGRFAHPLKMWSLGMVLCRACRTEHFVSDRRLMEAYGVNVASNLSTYAAFAREPPEEVDAVHAAWALEFTREQPAPLLALFAGKVFYFPVLSLSPPPPRAASSTDLLTPFPPNAASSTDLLTPFFSPQMGGNSNPMRRITCPRLEFSHQAIDFSSHARREGRICFFWRPHVERLLDLQGVRRALKEAWAAAATPLQARLRALVVRRRLRRATVQQVAARSHMKALQPWEKVAPLFHSCRMQQTKELLAWSEDCVPAPWSTRHGKLRTRSMPYTWLA